MSPKAAGLAIKSGYKNVRVYLEGEPAWTNAGLPTYASTGFVSKGNIVLVDLRSTNKAETARIPRSVSIPYKTLKDRTEDIPKKAPVVLYSDDAKETGKALDYMRDEGFKKVSLVYGDLDRWLKSEGNYESGPVVTEVSWTRKLGEGEVSVSDFEKAASGFASFHSPSPLILDVRTNEETKTGKIKTAAIIPLDELSARIGELPKDRKIYIHCSTGARAEMAYKELQKNGYNSFFLVADVECEGNECEIEE